MKVSIWMYVMQQCAVNAVLMMSLKRMCRLPRASRWRLMTAAFLAAAGDALCVTMPAGFRLLLFTPLMMLLPLGVWPGLSPALRLRLPLSLAALSLIASAAARWASPLSRMLPPLAAAAAAALFALASHRRETPLCLKAVIRYQGQKLTLTGLVDTGNLLRDPLTRLPVIVISRTAATRLLPRWNQQTLTPGMRLIPVRTVAGRAMMPLLRPGSIHLEHQGKWVAAQAMIGLSTGGYSGFQALIPQCILQDAPLLSESNDTSKEDCPVCP